MQDRSVRRQRQLPGKTKQTCLVYSQAMMFGRGSQLEIGDE
jgi:hypothetical protein